MPRPILSLIRTAKRLADWFICPRILQSDDTMAIYHARLSVWLLLALIIWAPIFSLLFKIGLHNNQGALACLTAGLIGCAAFYCSRRWGSRLLTGHLICVGLFTAVLWAAPFSGGLHSPTLMWILAVPMLAAILCGPWSAILWFFLCISTDLALFILVTKFGPTYPLDESDWSMLMVSCMLGLGTFVLSLTIIYELLKAHALDRFNAANARLEAQNRDLIIARDAAEAASRAKSDFLANMSHEIRTPMTAILGFSDMLLSPDMSAQAWTEAAQTIQRNGQHLLSILNDILDLSKIDAGRMTVEPRRFNIAEAVESVVHTMRGRAKSKSVIIDAELAADLPAEITNDPTRFKQVLMNLVGNAIKFTPQGSIRIIVSRVSSDGIDRLRADVVDTGIGMDAEEAVRLFAPFAQADTSMSRRFGGTGLGLSLSRRFARLMGGDVTLVESTPAQGSRFRVEIDMGQASPESTAPASAPTTSPPRPPGDSKMAALNAAILLAEDGPDNQRLISHVLRKAGADVTVVDNGRRAVDAALKARAEGRPFDVILMDMQMPLLDGYQATAELRQRGYTGPIIALTAHAMAHDRKICLDAGCDDYATKPIDWPKLLGLIREYQTGSETTPPPATPGPPPRQLATTR